MAEVTVATPIYIYIQLFIALITDFTLCSSMALLVSYLSTGSDRRMVVLVRDREGVKLR